MVERTRGNNQQDNSPEALQDKTKEKREVKRSKNRKGKKAGKKVRSSIVQSKMQGGGDLFSEVWRIGLRSAGKSVKSKRATCQLELARGPLEGPSGVQGQSPWPGGSEGAKPGPEAPGFYNIFNASTV